MKPSYVKVMAAKSRANSAMAKSFIYVFGGWVFAMLLVGLLTGCGRETSRKNCISCDGKLSCSTVQAEQVVCPPKVDIARQI